MTTPPPPLDVTTLLPELAGQERYTVRLHPRRSTEPGLHESKVGGMFLWPADEPWPSCPVGRATADPQLKCNRRFLEQEKQRRDQSHRADPAGRPHGAYVGVLQLRAADVPELLFPEGMDLFQLLWCPHDHPGDYCPDCRVFWQRAADVVDPLSAPPAPDIFETFHMPHPCRVSPERVGEYPSIADLPEELQGRIWEWEATPDAEGYEYQYDLSVAPGMKVGGYPSWTQEPNMPSCRSCGADMDYLLTVSDGEGGEKRWMPDDIRAMPDLDGRRLASTATGLWISREGPLHVFICHRCPGWPIDWVV